MSRQPFGLRYGFRQAVVCWDVSGDRPCPTRTSGEQSGCAAGVSCHDAGVDVLTSLPAFLLAVLLISASPGPAMALILRRAALHGTRAAVPTVLGLELGLYVWALAAGAGSGLGEQPGSTVVRSRP